MRYISRTKPITATALKRKEIGTVVVHHNNTWENVRFTRVHGGWLRESDFRTPEVVSSTVVANECNHAFGCRDSWARIY